MADTTPTARAIAPTVAALPGSAAERFSSRVAARFRDGGEWKEQTYSEVGKAIDELALGLIELGIEPGDRVCILANTRLDWTLASYAISAAGAVAARVSDQLPERVQVGGRELRREGDLLRGRGPAPEDRPGPRRAA